MQQIIFENRPVDPNAAKPELDATIVSPDAFRTLGVPMLRGRDFLASDTPKSEYVVILGASTAKRYWSNEDPIGHRISVDNGQHWWRIIGVVGDIHFYGLDHPAPDEIYGASSQFPGTGNFVLRTSLDPISLQNVLEKSIHDIDPEQPVTDIRTLREIRDDSLKNPKVTSLLLSAFAGLALVLAATGLFGVVSFLVSQRTREIGIRIALGARKSAVLLNVLNQGMRMVLVGLGLGFVLALVATRAVRSLLFDVSATDALTFAGVSIVLVGTALLASYFPARRASQVEPMEALRYE
jgi:predicted permease